MNIRMRIVVGSILALALAGLGTLHILWAVGIPFPAATFDELGGAVVPSEVWPSTVITLVVAAGLVGASLSVIFRMIDLTRQRSWLTPLLTFAAFALAVVFAVRAIVGFVVSSGLLPSNPADAVYHQWDLWVYSPLCVAFALCALAVARPRREIATI